MKVSLKDIISSEVTQNEMWKSTFNISKIMSRVSTGTIGQGENPRNQAIASKVSYTSSSLVSIQENISKNVNLLQTYENAIQRVTELLNTLKNIAERASGASPEERIQFQKNADDIFKEIRKVARLETFDGRKIARGGFSNKIIDVQDSSGKLPRQRIDVSGINLGVFNVEDNVPVTISVFSDTGSGLATSVIFAGGTPVSTETIEVRDNVLDFENNGIRIFLPENSTWEDFSAGVTVTFVGDKHLIELGDNRDIDFMKIKLTSLEPESFLQGAFTFTLQNPHQSVGVIQSAINEIEAKRTEIGVAITRLEERKDVLSQNIKDLAVNKSIQIDVEMDKEFVKLTAEQVKLNLQSAMLVHSRSKLEEIFEILARR